MTMFFCFENDSAFFKLNLHYEITLNLLKEIAFIVENKLNTVIG